MSAKQELIIWIVLIITIVFVISFVIGVLVSAYFQLKVPPDDSELLIVSQVLGR